MKRSTFFILAFVVLSAGCSGAQVSRRELHRQLALARANCQARVDQLQNEIDNLRSAAAERDGLRVKLEMIQQRLDEATAKNAEWDKKFDDVTAELAGLDRLRDEVEAARRRAAALEAERDEIRRKLRSFVDLDRVGVDVTPLGVRITVQDAILFDSARADLRNGSETLLAELAKVLKESPAKQIRVVGHTDSIPIMTNEFPSNWELSVARAMSVLRYLVRVAGLSPERFVVMGLGPYQPIGDNRTAEGRARNRRVEIYLIPEAED